MIVELEQRLKEIIQNITWRVKEMENMKNILGDMEMGLMDI